MYAAKTLLAVSTLASRTKCLVAELEVRMEMGCEALVLQILLDSRVRRHAKLQLRNRTSNNSIGVGGVPRQCAVVYKDLVWATTACQTIAEKKTGALCVSCMATFVDSPETR